MSRAMTCQKAVERAKTTSVTRASKACSFSVCRARSNESHATTVCIDSRKTVSSRQETDIVVDDEQPELESGACGIRGNHDDSF